MSLHDRFDVIIIGGGLSGLSAAQRLLANNSQTKVVVLEASDRVGGRTKSSCGSRKNCELGGAYVGPAQDRIVRVAQQVGIETYKVYNTGQVAFRVADDDNNNRVVRGSIDMPPIGIFALLDFNSFLVKIDKLTQQMDVHDPAKMEHAFELDSISVKAWITENCCSDNVKHMLTRLFDTIVFTPSDKISMLFLLWYAKSGGTLKRLMDVTDGAQEQKFVGGASQVSVRMAERLGSNIVRLQCPVTKISQHNDSVCIQCRNGALYTAQKVIVAISPPLYNNIRWEPQLPSTKLDIAQSMTLGTIIKTVMYYKTAWWRDMGLNGQIWDPNGPVLYSMDDCKNADSTLDPAIMGFVVANDAKKWGLKTREERRQAIMAQYQQLFGCNDEATNPVDYIEFDWKDEEFVTGGPTAVPAMGKFVSIAKHLTEAFDNVHFAGTETATEWAGYMDGAVQAGERAADEVTAALFGKESVASRVMATPVMLPITSARPTVVEKVLAFLFDWYVSWFCKR